MRDLPIIQSILLATLLALSAPLARADAVSEAQSAIMKGKYERAVDLLHPAAAAGDAKAQYVLGNMYRSGWATKENQEMVLALRLRRSFFDRILGLAVASSFDASVHPTEDAWRAAGATSDVRLQWDPDHEPMGSPVARRAIQLGLRGKVLGDYASKDIRSADNQLLEVIDMTAFVGEQKAVLATAGISAFTMPVERVYRPADAAIAQRIGLD